MPEERVTSVRSSRAETYVLGGPCPDGIVPARQPPGQVGVEALDSGASASDTSRRPGPTMIGGYELVAQPGVVGMGLGDASPTDR